MSIKSVAIILLAFGSGIMAGKTLPDDLPVPIMEASTVAKGIAAQFERGTITKVDLSPLGISELGTTYLGKPVIVSWYSSGRFRTLILDGTEAVFPHGVDQSIIFKAAMKRADHLIDEKMAELEQQRASAVNASLTRIRIPVERRGSTLYARNALVASPLAVTIGGRENLQSCSTFCCPSGRIIKYSANAAADMRGSGRSFTDG